MKRHGLWNLNCTKIRCLSNHFSATGLNSNLHQLLSYFFIQLHNLLPNSRTKLNFRKHTTEVLSYGCVRPIYIHNHMLPNTILQRAWKNALKRIGLLHNMIHKTQHACLQIVIWRYAFYDILEYAWIKWNASNEYPCSIVLYIN